MRVRGNYMHNPIKPAMFLWVVLAAGAADAAYIKEYKGWVDYRPVSRDWVRLVGGASPQLKTGDEIRTRRASMADISMDDGSRVVLSPNSSFVLAGETQTHASVGLGFGRLRAWVRKFSKKFDVKTPTAVCAVRGTDFTVAADETGATRVEVYEGIVAASGRSGGEVMVHPGEFSEIRADAPAASPQSNPAPPAPMESAVGDAKAVAMSEVYKEISKEAVISQAQLEIQTAEYQNRKTAIDAFGHRVRMEEYITRPAPEQFKYVVLNTRDDRFDFGKILFIFNTALPADLTLATKNMLTATGATAPQWQLTDLSSVMSNTRDTVVEEATNGRMVADNPASPAQWNLFFSNYAFYVQGGDQAVENGGKGRLLWSFADTNFNNIPDAGEFTYLTGAGTYGTGNLNAPTASLSYPGGPDVFHTVTRNVYKDGTWINAEDFVVFDDGKTAAMSDFTRKTSLTMGSVADKLNFERSYTSSLFSGRKIDLVYSAKLLKDAGLLRLPE